MKLVVCFAVAALAGIGCPGTEPKGDAPVVVEEGPPTGFTFSAIGDRSFASFGWSGVIHNLQVPDGTPFGVKTTNCPTTDGLCAFEGPTEPQGAVKRRRCLNQMSKECSADMECPADGTLNRRCVFVYDPPTGTPLQGMGGLIGACGYSYIPIAAAGTPATISGTIDQTSGELNIQNLTIIIQLNGAPGTFRGACEECVGDPTANDGLKQGRCQKAKTDATHAAETSLDDGVACDVNRYGSIPGYDASYSMDCSPTTKTGDQQNLFGGVFTSSGYQVTLSDASPDCTDPRFPGKKCFCGMCPDHPGVAPKACLSNADCGGEKCGELPPGCDPNVAPLDDNLAMNPAFDATHLPDQCKGAGMGAFFATAPNSCVRGDCKWDAAKGLGTCMSTLTGGMVGCYPGVPGASIIAPGGVTKQGKVWIVDTATARCTRTAAAPNNAQLGLPGLTFQKRSFRVIPVHASESAQ